ncbi:MAG TPA: DNRLRE domain-containing protein [Syntrophomonadaceae bacterium]|nr:DNRLRE domain-containing protein [Syntrophomonadaceae bacterium]HPU49865.1 DNRLRE domain-containing protein [Syntrophomonadaceae bacterium]
MPVSFFLPVNNVYIASAYPDQNFANRNQGDVLFVGSFTGAGDIYRSLLEFDLSDPNHGIPPNSTIVRGELLLSMYRNDNPGTARVDVLILDDVFDERTVTFNTSLSTRPIGISVVPQAAPDLVIIDITDLVLAWYQGGILKNVELRGLENNNNNIIGFRSTRFSNSAVWPRLRVVWSKGTVSDTLSDILSGAPATSTLIDIRGKEQATFLIQNTTDGTLQGHVILQNTGQVPVSDPSTQFSIPPGQERVVNYIAAVDFLQLGFTAAGNGNYFVMASTRDE